MIFWSSVAPDYSYNNSPPIIVQLHTSDGIIRKTYSLSADRGVRPSVHLPDAGVEKQRLLATTGRPTPERHDSIR